MLFSALGFSQNKCSHKGHGLNIEKTSSTDNLRSDTINILNYNINLDITDFANQSIKGSCTIDFVSLKNNVTTLSLDLLRLTVDSILQQNQVLSFSYNDTLLVVQLANGLSINDTSTITVFYGGTPQSDPSGWGGWYFQGGYSYNLGVGFQDNPHNYGRVWHPCFDNFVERATYDFSIKTDVSKSVYCNGLPISETVNGNVKTTVWRMNQEIPTYLACIAVGDYTHVEQSYISSLTNNVIPIFLTAKASDTTNLKNSFVNLTGALSVFEQGYGSYEWDKVGYSLVPFNAGAMEHATNIAYPISSANGSLSSETLMAHELSHHWWGNLVTCRTAEDMWINEGMASYSERLFLEHLYGYNTYINSIRDNHKDVLHHAHINDNGFRALHGIPHEYTYGDHSYNKGADVAHTLRSYMGDTAFFNALTGFLQSHKYQDVDAYDFRDYINTHSSVNVTNFFDGWIFNAGFPQFGIDSVKTVATGNGYENTVYIQQKLRSAPNLFKGVPLEITFRGINWEENTQSLVINGTNGALENFTFTTPFAPIASYLNASDKISQAVTAESKVVQSTGIKNFSYAFFQVSVSNISDSAYLRVEHNWVAPDDFKDGSKHFLYNISTERYWNVTGILPSTFDAKIKIYYNGRTNLSGNLDTELTTSAGFNEDSLVVFYRANASEEWQEITNYTQSTMGSKTDGYGRVEINEFRLGQYTFGWKRGSVGVEERSKKTNIKVTPSLASESVRIETEKQLLNAVITIYTINGKLVYQSEFVGSKTISIDDWKVGKYVVKIVEGQREIGNSSFIKK